MKVLLVGNGAREASIAWKLKNECKVFAVCAHRNPTIDEITKASGGELFLGSTTDPRFVVECAKKAGVDLAFVSSDSPLEAGVIDGLAAASIRTVGPTRMSAEIEWNKAFGRKLVERVMPEYAPKFWIIKNTASCEELFTTLKAKGDPIVVKPVGLTAGKGVKVMGEHFDGFDSAKQYALELLSKKGTGEPTVIIEEKIEGKEFTFQVFTDGKNVIPLPATFDYPYRYEGDTGPGTGGMGSYSSSTNLLPFMDNASYVQCLDVATRAIAELNNLGKLFCGVLYIGFFLTKSGVKIVEFNARFGDPECTNIMTRLESPLLPALEAASRGELTTDYFKFKNKCSVTKYLVTPEYALREGKAHIFKLDQKGIEAMGLNVFFSAAQSTGNPDEYVTTGNSRTVAITALADTIFDGSKKVDEAIAKCFSGDLEFRRDVGTSR